MGKFKTLKDFLKLICAHIDLLCTAQGDSEGLTFLQLDVSRSFNMAWEMEMAPSLWMPLKFCSWRQGGKVFLLASL